MTSPLQIYNLCIRKQWAQKFIKNNIIKKLVYVGKFILKYVFFIFIKEKCNLKANAQVQDAVYFYVRSSSVVEKLYFEDSWNKITMAPAPQNIPASKIKNRTLARHKRRFTPLWHKGTKHNGYFANSKNKFRIN